jgi:hypothetical protein
MMRLLQKVPLVFRPRLRFSLVHMQMISHLHKGLVNSPENTENDDDLFAGSLDF